MSKCSHGLTSAECYVCASPKYGSDTDTAALMESSNLPTALHLANALEQTMQWPLHGKAADELRRLSTQADRDTALLRQCLEALEPWAGLSHTNLIAALRERLEGKA